MESSAIRGIRWPACHHHWRADKQPSSVELQAFSFTPSGRPGMLIPVASRHPRLEVSMKRLLALLLAVGILTAIDPVRLVVAQDKDKDEKKDKDKDKKEDKDKDEKKDKDKDEKKDKDKDEKDKDKDKGKTA